MAESHKFTTVEKLREVFPEAPISENRTRGTVAVFNEKENVKETITKGQYVVKIADRYEVHDEEPEKAKPAEATKETPKKETKRESLTSEDTPKAVEGNQTVVPEELGTAPGPEPK